MICVSTLQLSYGNMAKTKQAWSNLFWHSNDWDNGNKCILIHFVNGKWTVFILPFSSLFNYSKLFYNTGQHSHAKQVTSLHKTNLLIRRYTHSHTNGTAIKSVWDSVSCPRTLQHVDQRSRGNPQSSDW